MKLLLSLTITIAICATLSNGFLFSKKKDGCDPNPCKNDAKCVLTSRTDKDAFKCQCSDKYYGVKCSKKTGCAKNPCKAGTCINDSVDKSKYKCKCPNGKVGDKCDKTDPCIKKEKSNWCQNGECDTVGTKAVCKCDPGFKTGFRGKCNHRDCQIKQYKNKHILTKNAVKAFYDSNIKDAMDDLADICEICHVKLRPKKAFTKEVKGKKSNDNHSSLLVGRGMVVEICSDDGKLLCNGHCQKKVLKDRSDLMKPARCFLNALDAINWKQSYLIEGLIYFDDQKLNANTAQYNKLKDGHQKGCEKEKVWT